MQETYSRAYVAELLRHAFAHEEGVVREATANISDVRKRLERISAD